MTAIITDAPITNHSLKLPQLRFPRFGWIGALLAATPRSLGDAFNLAYVNPYASVRRQPEVAPDEDLEGRDPSW